jgi:2-polyprenyl-3-methyl-5-hydroxy-6-metoxy-1,4-benzoquinol methylase
MDEETESSVAKSLEANPTVLPYLPDLLIDLWDLGCSPDVIAEIIRPLELTGPAIRILDLGCGKGAAGITLASRFGFRCLGVDGCDPFLQEARRRAEAHGVAELCEFRPGDIRTAVQQLTGYDVVIYASVGDVLGSPAECVCKLRRTVRPGRFIVIDDGFLKRVDRLEQPGYESCLAHRPMLDALTSCGDHLVSEVILPDERVRSVNRRYLGAIQRRASDLATRVPEIAEDVSAYVRRQEFECDLIDEHLASAVWLLQRADDGGSSQWGSDDSRSAGNENSPRPKAR